VLHRWEDVTEDVLWMVEPEVAAGFPPPPVLAAFAGDEPVAVVGLRPFGPGEVVDPLVEVLALLLPLGADRVVLALPARIWDADDPCAGDVAGVDLRTTAVAITTVDGHGRATPDLHGSVHPYGIDDHGGHGWLPTDLPADLGAPEGPATPSLACLVGGRDQLAAEPDPTTVALQFARCLLRGHKVILSPHVAERLEAATTSAPG
jgi:hypothetical protein